VETSGELLSIVRETLSNVARHAQARHATVTVRPLAGGLRLEIADDGHGFDPAAPLVGAHQGLHNVADRTARLGGTLQIESRSGAGTRIIVEDTARIRTRSGCGMTPSQPDTVHPLRLLIVDDHEVVRQGLVALLGRRPEFSVVAQAGTVAEAIAAARRHEHDRQRSRPEPGGERSGSRRHHRAGFEIPPRPTGGSGSACPWADPSQGRACECGRGPLPGRRRYP